MPRDDERREKSVRCSFCGKTDGQVDKIIAGPGVYICNECIDLCSAIMAEEQAAAGRARKKQAKDFRLPTPMEIKKGLDEYVIGIAFLVFFIISFVIFKIVQQIIKNIFGGHIFLQLDRLLGFVIGLVEGLAVIGIIIIVLVVQPWFPTDSLLDGSFFMRIFSPFLSVPINAISEKITDATAFVQVEKCLTMC